MDVRPEWAFNASPLVQGQFTVRSGSVNNLPTQPNPLGDPGCLICHLGSEDTGRQPGAASRESGRWSLVPPDSQGPINANSHHLTDRVVTLPMARSQQQPKAQWKLPLLNLQEFLFLGPVVIRRGGSAQRDYFSQSV